MFCLMLFTEQLAAKMQNAAFGLLHELGTRRCSVRIQRAKIISRGGRSSDHLPFGGRASRRTVVLLRDHRSTALRGGQRRQGQPDDPEPVDFCRSPRTLNYHGCRSRRKASSSNEEDIFPTPSSDRLTFLPD
ncbi:unnamed protein product, partial [Musa banksii]